MDCAVIAVAAICWLLALLETDPTGVSGFGLLAALPPTYYLALVVLTLAFAARASQTRAQPAVLAAYVVALVVVLHATTAILYPEPRYTWTYKHIGVIDYVLAHGRVDRSIDIYHNWPGFFALNAWFSKAAGISPLEYAGWAQLFFGLVGVAAVVFAVRGVTRDPRLQWSAAWLFVVANWIGQDYLAPQAFAFVLSLVVLGLAIRCAPWAAPPRTRLGWAALRTANRVATALLRGRGPRARPPTRAPLGGRGALVVCAVCSLAIIISHQLTPISLVLSLAVLALAMRRPPIYLVGALAAVQTWWVSLSYDFVSRHFNLFEFDPSVSARTVTGALPGVALGADLSRAAIVLVLLLALAGLLRRARLGHWHGPALVLASAPALVLLVQSYGGEGPLRVFLFALPWLCFFAAVACRPPGNASTLLGRSWRLIAASAAVGIGALFGYFGQEPINYVTHDDVTASRWYLDHAPEGSSLTYFAPNFPERLNARYVKHIDEPRDLLQMPGFVEQLRAQTGIRSSPCGRRCDPRLAPATKSFLLTDPAPRHYLIVSPSQERYARYHGIASREAYKAFTRALLASRDFDVAYRRGDAVVFELAYPSS